MRISSFGVLLLAGCGGSDSSAPRSYGATAETTGVSGGEADARSGFGVDTPPPAPPTEPAMEPLAITARQSAPGASIGSLFEFGNDEDRGAIAQEAPPRREPGAPQPTPATTTPVTRHRQAPDENQSATDASSGPLLIYQAVLHLAVYQVQDNQRAVIGIAREVGGYLAQQSDTLIVVRVPVAKFNEAIGRIEALGDVLHRNIQATDVSEEFRDLQIRLRNMEQVRDRLAALLAQSRTVEESLQIERELERLTTQIESMKGRLRFLEDRIAYSTITVNFSPRESESLQGELFNLPFEFLYNMGLRPLLNLR